jgi:hypothetical protein
MQISSLTNGRPTSEETIEDGVAYFHDPWDERERQFGRHINTKKHCMRYNSGWNPDFKSKL